MDVCFIINESNVYKCIYFNWIEFTYENIYIEICKYFNEQNVYKQRFCICLHDGSGIYNSDSFSIIKEQLY